MGDIAMMHYPSLVFKSYDTGHGSAFQMLAAYPAIVRSLENLPEPATFKIALCAQASGWA
jgi:hypothetical protein